MSRTSAAPPWSFSTGIRRPLDSYADLVLNEEIGEVLGDAVGVN